MSKSRVAAVEKFEFGAHHDSGVFFNGLVACLSPATKCEALVTNLFQPYAKRSVIVRRIVADMQREVLPCHLDIAASLTTQLESLSGKERVTCAVILLEIVENLPGDALANLIRDLVLSSNGNIRKQVYRRFKARPELGCPDTVIASWIRYGDFEACRLLIDRAPLPILTECFSDMEQSVASEGWLLARLYLRFHGTAPATLQRLRKLDPITHAYVATRLGRKVPASHLVALYRERMFDQRGGLIVWCAGQMGYWNAVQQMQTLRQHPPDGMKGAYRRALGL